ncbi:hypothetical protein FRC12_007766 [Ceratobasidium sp. 428]|nr:hypothetical protein FRC12_007766 [Ceratobasidium sp. 428]
MMRCLTTIFLSALSFSVTSMAAKKLPLYEHLYSFSLTLSPNHLVDGPLGSRFGLGAISGNMTSPQGKVIATVVPGVGGETGLVDKNGNFQIQSRNIFQFVDDKKYVFIEGSGIGPLTGNPLDVHHVETDSPSRLAWNGYFIVVNVSLPSPASLIGDAFRVRPVVE